MFTEANLTILDQLTGNRISTLAMMRGEWLGGALAAGTAGQAPVQLAQAGAQAIPQGGGVALPRPGDIVLPGGRIRIGPGIFTAAQLLQSLQNAAERRQVEQAMARFGLDAGNPADVLAARAYVWGRNMAPMAFWDVPYTGVVNERVAVALMRHERDNPTTLGRSVQGDRASRAAIESVVRTAVAGGALTTPQAFERRSAVDPALSTTSRAARTALGILSNNSWRAHHLIPFAVVAAMPVPAQLAIAASGWRMDSLENLIALPANHPTYVGFPNLTRLPIHNSAHTHYSNAAALRTAAIAAGAQNMAATQIRAQLLAAEQAMTAYLLVKGPFIHPLLR